VEHRPAAAGGPPPPGPVDSHEQLHASQNAWLLLAAGAAAAACHGTCAEVAGRALPGRTSSRAKSAAVRPRRSAACGSAPAASSSRTESSARPGRRPPFFGCQATCAPIRKRP
jgi:hypothetical protein